MIEPVAYINVEERKLEWAKPIIWNTPTVWKLDKVPLYTHPHKQLSDEECEAIINQHDWFSKSWKDMAKAIHDAILRKNYE